MKIVQIVTQMEAAGAQRVAYLLHQGFKTRVRRSELWFLYTKRAAYAEQDGVSSLFDHPPKALDYAVIASRLYRRLREVQPDVVITHTHYSNVLGQAVAAAAGVPARFSVHHNPITASPKGARALDRAMGRMGIYTGIVSVSEAVAATLCDYPQSYLRLVRTIHNGVELAKRDGSLDVRSHLGIPARTPLLLAVGRLSKEKNHELLLRALPHIPDAHLAIVGGGALKDFLTALTAELGLTERVHFAGELPPSAVAAYLHACDVFVLPSLSEGLPMAAIEALHAGALIVASDIPASREVLSDAAVMFPSADQAAFCGAIQRVLQIPTLAQEMRLRAAQRAQRFTTGAMVSGYTRLIHGDSLTSPEAKLTLESWIKD